MTRKIEKTHLKLLKGGFGGVLDGNKDEKNATGRPILTTDTTEVRCAQNKEEEKKEGKKAKQTRKEAEMTAADTVREEEVEEEEDMGEDEEEEEVCRGRRRRNRRGRMSRIRMREKKG